MSDLNSLKAAKLNLEGHLETCYTKCRTIHTSSWKSWGRVYFDVVTGEILVYRQQLLVQGQRQPL